MDALTICPSAYPLRVFMTTQRVSANGGVITYFTFFASEQIEQTFERESISPSSSVVSLNCI